MIRRLLLSAAVCAALASPALAANTQIDPNYNTVKLDPSSAAVKPGPTSSTTGRSGVIATGGTAQQVMAANANRRSFYVFNPDPSEQLWCSFTTATPAANAAGSFSVGPTNAGQGSGGFGMEVSPTTNALYCNAATTNHPYTAWESN